MTYPWRRSVADWRNHSLRADEFAAATARLFARGAAFPLLPHHALIFLNASLAASVIASQVPCSAGPASQPPPTLSTPPHLRVAFVLYELNYGDILFPLLAPLFHFIPRANRTSLTVFTLGPPPRDERVFFSTAAHVSLQNLPPPQQADAIARTAPHVLVDLTTYGSFSAAAAINAFLAEPTPPAPTLQPPPSKKLRPVVAAFLAWPGAKGCELFDFEIWDRVTVTPDMARLFGRKLAVVHEPSLSGGHKLMYPPAQDGASCAARRWTFGGEGWKVGTGALGWGGPTACATHQIWKLTPDAMGAFTAAMRRVANLRLVLWRDENDAEGHIFDFLKEQVTGAWLNILFLWWMLLLCRFIISHIFDGFVCYKYVRLFVLCVES